MDVKKLKEDFEKMRSEYEEKLKEVNEKLAELNQKHWYVVQISKSNGQVFYLPTGTLTEEEADEIVRKRTKADEPYGWWTFIKLPKGYDLVKGNISVRG